MHVGGDIIRAGEEMEKSRTFLPRHIGFVHRLLLRRRELGGDKGEGKKRDDNDGNDDHDDEEDKKDKEEREYRYV